MLENWRCWTWLRLFYFDCKHKLIVKHIISNHPDPVLYCFSFKDSYTYPVFLSSSFPSATFCISLYNHSLTFSFTLSDLTSQTKRPNTQNTMESGIISQKETNIVLIFMFDEKLEVTRSMREKKGNNIGSSCYTVFLEWAIAEAKLYNELGNLVRLFSLHVTCSFGARSA